MVKTMVINNIKTLITTQEIRKTKEKKKLQFSSTLIKKERENCLKLVKI